MGDTTQPQDGPRAGRREWLGLLVLALPTLLIAFDIGALFLALPHLSTDLDASSTQQLWITDIYGFMLAGFLITMGTLGDRIGRRKLLMIGASAFTAASVLAAFSTSAEMLIIARDAQQRAGATLGPSTLALISNMFRNDKQRGLAISLWATCQFGGAAMGPVIGGLLLQQFWWGSVFLLAVPVMLLLLVFGPLLLPEYRDTGAGRLDLTSVALSLLAILPVIYGIKELAVHGGQAPIVPIVSLVFGASMAVVFGRRQLRLTSPLLDLGLFRDRSFSVVLSAMLLPSAVLAGTSFLTSQYVQSVEGLSPGVAGLWQAPTGLGIAAGTMLAPALLRWMKPVVAMVTGMGISTVALLVLTQVDSTGALIVVVLAIAVVAFGTGPGFVVGTGMVVGSAPPEKAGSAASLSETSGVFGSTLGLAIFGSIGAAVFRDHIAGSVPPDAPQDARETIAGAVSAASRLPEGPQNDLLHAAREAFTSGLNVVAGIGAAILLILGVIVFTALRQPSSRATEPVSEAQPSTTE